MARRNSRAFRKRWPGSGCNVRSRIRRQPAEKELALAALVHAEAEKVQEVAKAGILGPVSPEQVAEINRTISQVVREAGEKEDHLRQKLMLLLAVKEETSFKDIK